MKGFISGIACFFGMHTWYKADYWFATEYDWTIWQCENCGKCELE